MWDSVYETGTIAIAAGATTVVGTGTAWGSLASQSNFLIVDTKVALIREVVDDTHLTIAAWQGGVIAAGSDYELVQFPSASLYAAEQIRDIIAKIATQGFMYGVEGAAPDPAFGNNNDFAIKINSSPWKVWQKIAGVWTLQSIQGEAAFSLLDYVPSSERAAVQAYTSTMDLTTQINQAFADLNAAKGKMRVPAGRYCHANKMGVAGLEGVIIEGDGGRDPEYTGTKGSVFCYTGTGADVAVDFSEHKGITVKEIQFVYVSDAYTGTPIDTHTSFTTGCFSLFDRLQSYQITNSGHNAGQCLYYKNNVNVVFRECGFSHADYGTVALFTGEVGEVNEVTFDNCISIALGLSAFVNPVVGVTIKEHNFELGDTNNPTGVLVTHAMGARNLTIEDCKCADSSASGTFFDFQTSTHNLNIVRTAILSSGGTTVGVNLAGTIHYSPNIQGCDLDGLTTAILFNAPVLGGGVTDTVFANVTTPYSGWDTFTDAHTKFSGNSTNVTDQDVNRATGREKMTAPRTYYVRKGGNNSHTGRLNTDAGAFATPQKAIDVVSALDLNGFDALIQVGDDGGTPYTAALLLKRLVGGNCTIQGNVATPTNVVINVTGASAVAIATGQSHVNGWHITGVTLQTTTAGHAVSLVANSRCTLGVVRFNAVPAGWNQVDVTGNATLEFLNNYTVAGGGAAHVQATDGGRIKDAGVTVTLSGTPAFTLGYAVAARGGGVLINGNTFSGTATGPRYNASDGGSIATLTGSTTYLPGNAAGTSTTGYYN